MGTFRGKKSKDIEAASETIISNTNFHNSALNKTSPGLNPSITEQQLLDGSIEDMLDITKSLKKIRR